MMRLWMRLSLLISGLLLAVIVATAVLAFVYEPMRRHAVNASAQRDGSSGTRLTLELVGVVALVGIIGVGVGVVVSRAVSAPIARLAAAAHHIGEGELQTRVSVGGSQELVELAHAFNTMAGELQHAEQLRANLMADVSHELRTPLTALDRVYALDEAEIADLYAQSRLLIRLVNDLRELALADAHQLPLDKQPTDLARLVDETLRVFAPLAEEQGVRLERQLEHLPALCVDASRIRQVLHNLLAAALRYTPRGGSATVVGRLEPDAVYLAVQDTGGGLEAGQLGQVFERFYRGDGRSQNRGDRIIKILLANLP